MTTLLAYPSQIISAQPDNNYLRGLELEQLSILEGHSLVIENGKIIDFIPNSSINKARFIKIIDVKDKTLTPGLIDCHTHTIFAGSRSDEFLLKLAGVGYEEIARKGGGIKKTVNSVRSSGFDELVEMAKPRIEYFISQGVTTLEIKSGYGLSFEDEIKILKVIQHLKNVFPIDIVPTFLGAHTFPAEYEGNHTAYIKNITEKMLPEIARNDLAKFCDVFCEKTAFSPEETDEIFKKAAAYNLKLKLHTDQFNSIGGIDIGLKNNAISIEHLEVISDNDLKKAAESESVCVLLPGVSFSLRQKYAPARKLISENAIVALATDFNPGSSHIANISMIMSLALVEMNMKAQEILSAFTINAAKALDMSQITGSLQLNKQADIAVFNCKEYFDIFYNMGKNLNCLTIKNGNIIYSDSRIINENN